ncbi:MAG: iron-containing alcohol dehydrogenase [Pseudomonadota bacterium]
MNPQVFSFQGAKKIIFGDGAIDQLAEEVKALSGAKPFIVIDKELKNVGMQGRIATILEKAGIPYAIYDQVTPEPQPEIADQGARELAGHGCNLVIGIGGGSSLDVAKAIAMLATNKGKATDYIGLEIVPKAGLPTILIPTTAGTGSEVTFTAVFTMREKKAKGGINSRFLYPDVALLDPELTVTAPPSITAATGMDAFTHALEAYTSLQANPLSDLVAEKAIALIGKNLKNAFVSGDDRVARREMLMGSLLGGMALASAGVGACHALAYPLGALFGIPHGLANAVLLPYIMQYNITGCVGKYARTAQLMLATSQYESADKAIDMIFALRKEIGIPNRLSELQIPSSSIEQMADAALKVARPIANNPRAVTKEGVVGIYQQAF